MVAGAAASVVIAIGAVVMLTRGGQEPVATSEAVTTTRAATTTTTQPIVIEFTPRGEYVILPEGDDGWDIPRTGPGAVVVANGVFHMFRNGYAESRPNQIGYETSTITQTGDAEEERSFSFIKPRSALTYSANPKRQTQLRVAREVSQLDFSDFVSATVFEEDDLALGNPNLKPESTWIAQLSEEWRFGELGVVKITAFHHWISDVEDLLPFVPPVPPPGDEPRLSTRIVARGRCSSFCNRSAASRSGWEMSPFSTSTSPSRGCVDELA